MTIFTISVLFITMWCLVLMSPDLKVIYNYSLKFVFINSPCKVSVDSHFHIFKIKNWQDIIVTVHYGEFDKAREWVMS